MAQREYRTRNLTLATDVEDDPVVATASPAERMSMVWQLTMQAWAFLEGLTNEPRLRRDVVCVVRGRR